MGHDQGLDSISRREADGEGMEHAISSEYDLTVSQGGTGRILEYFGPGVFNQSCTGKLDVSDELSVTEPCLSGLATISNMGAEVGATTSTFPYTPNMRAYLHATGRAPVAHAADKAAANGFLAADEGAEYDEVIEIVILYFL
jgi:homoaconitase